MNHIAPADVNGVDQLASPATELGARRPGVLVVDDEEGVRTLLATALPLHGFAVWVIPDGREAVGVYAEFRTRIDVVLLDVQMAGCDGPQTLAALRAIAPDVRACFMTGNPGHYTEQNLLNLGALAVLGKPFVIDQLADRLKSLIHQPAQTQPA